MKYQQNAVSPHVCSKVQQALTSTNYIIRMTLYTEFSTLWFSPVFLSELGAGNLKRNGDTLLQKVANIAAKRFRLETFS